MLLTLWINAAQGSEVRMLVTRHGTQHVACGLNTFRTRRCAPSMAALLGSDVYVHDACRRSAINFRKWPFARPEIRLGAQ